MSIIIGADIVPTNSNMIFFTNGNIETIIDEDLFSLLKNVDYRIFNLEVPLAYQKKAIMKEGPNLIASPECINGLKKIGIDLFTLANNHIMDHDKQGLYSTINTLNNANISYTGVGENIYTASKPYYFIIKEKCIGVYACVEHEFSSAKQDFPGANPFDPLDSPDHISEMQSNCDYIIVLYHGGKEQYRYPSPQLQKSCRKLVEKGADLVVCQHSHCIGSMEEYRGKTIIYGQGNFLFDHQNNDYWKTSLLIKITDKEDVEYIPLIKDGYGVKLAKGRDAKIILDSFWKRSEEIKKPGFIQNTFYDYANDNIDDYIICLLGINRNICYRILNRCSNNKLKKYIANQYMKKQRHILRNYIECEAHRELILNGLER